LLLLIRDLKEKQMSKRNDSREVATDPSGIAHASVPPTPIAPNSVVVSTEEEADPEYDQLIARMEEETERLFQELLEAQEAACRKRWWVLGFRTQVF
jgi:hypothetical protein